MFRSSPDVEHTESNSVIAAATTLPELIPLSHFELDHPQPPEGWSNFLGKRGITLRPDHIGRDAISSHDASRLIGEQREAEIRRQKLAKLAEQDAVEADRVKFAQILRGVPASAIPAGSTFAEAALSAELDSAAYQPSTLADDFFSSDGAIVYRPYPTQPDQE